MVEPKGKKKNWIPRIRCFECWAKLDKPQAVLWPICEGCSDGQTNLFGEEVMDDPRKYDSILRKTSLAVLQGRIRDGCVEGMLNDTDSFDIDLFLRTEED